MGTVVEAFAQASVEAAEETRPAVLVQEQVRPVADGTRWYQVLL